MYFHSRFVVDAPLEQVREFHLAPRNLQSLTPPPIFVRHHQPPEKVAEGTEMAFTLWLGPLPVPWRARFEQFTSSGFVDVMVKGPFRRWVHNHTFVPIDSERTEVIDSLEIELTQYPFWRTVGRFLTLGLPMLFTWRKWMTRRLLSRSKP